MTVTDRHNAVVNKLKDVIAKRTQERDHWRALARLRGQQVEALAQAIRAVPVDEVDAARKKK